MTFDELMTEAETLAGQLGIGSYALYRRIGVNASTWMRWKRGDHGPTFRKLQALQRGVDELRTEVQQQEKQSGTKG